MWILSLIHIFWSKIARHLPGFRTNKIYKKIIAILIYSFGIWLFENNIKSVFRPPYRSWKFIFDETFLYFISFIFPMWFFGARGKVMENFKFLRELKPIPRYIFAILLYIILQGVSFTLFNSVFE